MFCETFDRAQPGGGRAGDLEPELWGVSRLGEIHPGQNILNHVKSTAVVGCGDDRTRVAPPRDVRICNGRMMEAMDDNDRVVTLATYPKQPFDFAGRTGIVTFDVSADSEGSHAAWPEFWITDKPVPAMRPNISGVPSPVAQHSFGFAISGGCDNDPRTTGIGGVYVSRNFVYEEVPFTTVACVRKSKATDPALNHFQVRISQNRAEIWATDPGDPNLKLLAFADNLRLSFSKGLVWLNDTHYNASKGGDGSQTMHTFAWDNLGFDGPKTYRDLSFDVPDANIDVGGGLYQLGYAVPDNGSGLNLTTEAVFRRQTPTSALVTFNFYSYDAVVPSVSVNGNPAVATAWPFDPAGYFWRTLAVTVPLSHVKDGPNQLTFTTTGTGTVVANVNLILVAGAPVP